MVTVVIEIVPEICGETGALKMRRLLMSQTVTGITGEPLSGTSFVLETSSSMRTAFTSGGGGALGSCSCAMVNNDTDESG